MIRHGSPLSIRERNIMAYCHRSDFDLEVPTLKHDPPQPLPGEYNYEVKSWPAFFSKMITGEKKHDMRDKRDRAYKVGDRMLLQEYDPFGGGYTGRWAIMEITYITSNDTPCAMSSAALDNDFVILSVALVEHGITEQA